MKKEKTWNRKQCPHCGIESLFGEHVYCKMFPKNPMTTLLKDWQEEHKYWWLTQWQDTSAYAPDDDHYKWEIDCISAILEADRKALLKRIGEEVGKMRKPGHNKAHTWIQDGICKACKNKLTTEELIDDFGYNTCLEDIKSKILP